MHSNAYHRPRSLGAGWCDCATAKAGPRPTRRRMPDASPDASDHVFVAGALAHARVADCSSALK